MTLLAVSECVNPLVEVPDLNNGLAYMHMVTGAQRTNPWRKWTEELLPSAVEAPGRAAGRAPLRGTANHVAVMPSRPAMTKRKPN